MDTIVDIVRRRAESQPEKIAFTFIDDDGHNTSISFVELHNVACAVAQELLLRTSPEDTVVIMIPQGLSYIKALLGCLYAGVIAVPLYPPRNEQQSGRLQVIVENCRAKLVLSSDEIKLLLDRAAFVKNTLDIETCTSVRGSSLPIAAWGDLAFLQYTSGSTGSPKGVMVSHGNIISNLMSLQQATNCSAKDVFCNWLPLFHDLGLVNTIFLPLYLGCHSVLMSPGRFIRRPSAWLEAITEYGASVCGAPNFAYDHCVSRVKDEQLSRLNLSTWRVAFNAAEPVSNDTLESFDNRFRPTGFKRDAFYPSYGMAEATVFISGGRPDQPYIAQEFDLDALGESYSRNQPDGYAKKGQLLVACGKAQKDHTVKIVDSQTCIEAASGHIGEIWFSGPSVAQGYWAADEMTESCFRARLANDENEYLRTGDLGFIHDGELYIAGRIKDVLIIKGRNYYPQDLERHAFGSCSGIRQGGVVAFENQGSAVLVVELDKRAIKTFDGETAAKRISGAIFEQFDIVPIDVVFVKGGELTRTSSGKLQRTRTKARYNMHELNTLFSLKDQAGESGTPSIYSPPEDEYEQYLVDIWEGFFRTRVSRYDSFFQLGGQSVEAIQLMDKINRDWQCDLKVNAIFECNDLRSLAAYIKAGSVNEKRDHRLSKAKNISISHSQRSLWFIDQLEGGSPQYNILSVFKVVGEIDVQALDHSFNELIERHPVLRTHYPKEKGDVCAIVKDSWQFKLAVVSDVTEDDVNQFVSDEQRRVFDLTQDIPLRAHVLQVSKNNSRLLVCFHHIAVDGVSLGILKKELSDLYAQRVIKAGQKSKVPEFNFHDYVAFQPNRFGSNSASERYWAEQLKGIPGLHSLKLDYMRPSKQTYRGESLHSSMDLELLDKINQLARQCKTTLYAVMQTAFSYLLHRYSREDDIVVGTLYNNREIVEARDMVGYFVNPLVIRNNFSKFSNFEQQLKLNMDVLRQAMTHGSLPFVELVTLLNPDRSTSYHPLFQILFSFIDQDDNQLCLTGADLTKVDFPRELSRFDLTLEVTSKGDELDMVWEYSSDLFRRDTIERLQRHFSVLLKSIVYAPKSPLSELDILLPKEKDELLRSGLSSGINISYDAEAFQTIHHRLEHQANKTPSNVAVRFLDDCLTFQELSRRSNQMAHYLLSHHVGPGDLVAVCMERSLEMLISLWAVLKAGAAYLPLDPGYPLKRLEYMLTDSGAKLLLCRNEIFASTEDGTTDFSMFDIPEECEIANIDKMSFDEYDTKLPELTGFSSDALAYVIYTSGSTGKPKGVKISHSNVLNLFSGLDQQFPSDNKSNRWLAVTSICFDISVLELFWTSCRGDCVTIQSERPIRREYTSDSPMDFGLFYFSSDCDQQENQFELLIEGAKFADKNGLKSVWIPERHFHPFGGQFPNPAVAAAAVAAVTQNIKIHSGSVVLPLHDPVRVAEEWSMVDNLSSGRVALSIAPGWQPNDFTLAPEAYANRHSLMKSHLATLKKLWEGDVISRKNGVSQECEISIYPKPLQRHLPLWITAAGNIETFEYAGSIGANVLTHLLGQSLFDLEKKIDTYRLSLKRAGFDPEAGKVTLMLHTFIDSDESQVNALIEKPFKQYLADSISLIQPIAEQHGLNIENDFDEIIDHAYKRYREESILGSPERCMRKVRDCQKAGVDAIACLIDFGVNNTEVLARLPNIAGLQKRCRQQELQQALLEKRFDSFSEVEAIIDQHEITHLQCTPSYARELSDVSLSRLATLFVGGEALSDELAEKITRSNKLKLYNMYGPTEATVWVSAGEVTPGKPIRLAGPMVNTQFLVLDEHNQIAPYGVAGELCIAGPSISPGYLNRDDLTITRFIRNPFPAETGDKFSTLYRTGDLVRWQIDTSDDESHVLEYLGRIDQQVKIRGFRIEITEIESVLQECSSVDQAVVVCDNDSLLAYIVGNETSEGAIKQRVADSLPSYMHPEHYIYLNKFPLTANGKIDKKSLPLVSNQSKSSVTPESDTEKLIHTVWVTHLSTEKFGVDEDFFAIGGNSLLAVKVVNEINHVIENINLEVKDIFMAPSIQKLSRVISVRQTLNENSLAFESSDLEEMDW